MIRLGGAKLTLEEAAAYDEDERANLRSWGVVVPEPTSPPDTSPPKPTILQSPPPSTYTGTTMVTASAATIHSHGITYGTIGTAVYQTGGTHYNPFPYDWRLK